MVLDHAALFDPGFVAAARFMLPVAVASNDIVVTPSEAAARAIRRRFSPRRLVVIPWFGPDRRRAILPLAERKARVLVVAPSDGHKRLHLAIEAVAAARSLTGAKLALHIIGREGTGEALLRQSLERFDPGGQFVSRAQRVSDGELQLAYANAFAVMVPSIDEGFGLPLLEAAAHGTPVIHTRLGAMNEVLPIPGEAADCGVLDLTAQLVSSLDENAWAHAQANGFRALQRHSQEEFIARWRAVLTELDHAN
jgi:glycosyltransferase involved in cell wall biosynthesis